MSEVVAVGSAAPSQGTPKKVDDKAFFDVSWPLTLHFKTITWPQVSLSLSFATPKGLLYHISNNAIPISLKYIIRSYVIILLMYTSVYVFI